VRTKLLTMSISAMAVLGLLLVAPAGSALADDKVADVSPMYAACGTNPADHDSYHENVVDPAWAAANQRSGGSTSCAIYGVLQPTDNADYHCFSWASDYVHTWTYLRNLRTGVRGWVRDDLLKDNGSHIYCGF
jgi:hypothetical protein